MSPSSAGFVILLNVMRTFQTFLNSFQDYYVIWTSTIGAVRQVATLMIVYVLYSLAFAVGLHQLYLAQVRKKNKVKGILKQVRYFNSLRTRQ